MCMTPDERSHAHARADRDGGWGGRRRVRPGWGGDGWLPFSPAQSWETKQSVLFLEELIILGTTQSI